MTAAGTLTQSGRILRTTHAHEPDDVPACQRCDEPLGISYLCLACGELFRAPPGMDHFERLGLERRFDLDTDELERRYLELSRRLHPDRMVHQPAKVQAKALRLSAELNEAHEVLKDEARRAEYLLELAGGPSAEKDKRTPQEFLIEQMELREELEAAQAAADPAALDALRGRVEPRRRAGLAEVRAILTDPAFPDDGALLERARLELNTLRYWTNLSAEIGRSLEEAAA